MKIRISKSVGAFAAGVFILGRGAMAVAADEPSFTRDALPIFQAACQSCHRPGEAGPFSLMDYESARPYAKSIKKAVTERTMPPWFADPAHGVFSNDPRLTEEQVETISRWVDAGAPMGSPEDAPAPIKFVEGWAGGKPDVVVTKAEPYKLPATGIIDYQEFEMEFPGPDGWVTGIEIRPSNRNVAHHMNMFRQEPPENGRVGMREFITGYIPGGGPMIYPEGIGLYFKKGTKLFLQAHYVTSGKEEQDQPSIGFTMAREPIRQRMRLAMVGNYTFAIPPGDPNHEVRTKWRAMEDGALVGTYAHMHLRGKDFKFVAHYPDGREETLMSIPKYDFEWQLGYEFHPEHRPAMPKKTTIEIIAHLDNSPGNPFNPDPTATVKNGPQTFDEMVIGALFWVKDGEDLTQGEGKEGLWKDAEPKVAGAGE